MGAYADKVIAGSGVIKMKYKVDLYPPFVFQLSKPKISQPLCTHWY
jgi:hypothetical protein